MAKPLLHFPHNYNYVTRAVMYAWLNKHLKLGCEEPIVEEDFKPLSIAEMSVWDERHPKPPERRRLRAVAAAVDHRRLATADGGPRAAATPRRWPSTAAIVGGAVDVMIGHGVPPRGQSKRLQGVPPRCTWTPVHRASRR